ncbi:heterokaryon incompatibility protein-domain-containing protein [Tricladium varicosporioides]|nr:heterokaryon incompatibility protein-domain-containing protein [Hymenoscyphus varicosporioides]
MDDGSFIPPPPLGTAGPVVSSISQYTGIPPPPLGTAVPVVSNTYQFTRIPLHSLRLLLLHHGSGVDQIECSLHQTSFTSQVPYEALSYWWGEANEAATHQLLIHDQEVSGAAFPKTFYVKSNLHSALLRFRDPELDVLLWIDAICIDQSNIEEKNEQVARMAEIYHHAKHVRVWLGEAADDSDVAMNWIRKVVDLSSFDALATNPENLHKWSALAELMARVWFSRRWVVQELALAREATLYCGGESVGWTQFAGAVALYTAGIGTIRKAWLDQGLNLGREFSYVWYLDKAAVEATGASLLVNVTSNLFRRSDDGRIIKRLANLESLVAGLVAFNASDPKDIVYAFLSIANHVPPEPSIRIYQTEISSLSHITMEADYKKSIVETYIDFVALCIRYSGSLDVMCRHWAPMKHKDHVPEPTSTEIQDFLDLSRHDVPSQIYDLFGMPKREDIAFPEEIVRSTRFNSTGMLYSPETYIAGGRSTGTTFASSIQQPPQEIRGSTLSYSGRPKRNRMLSRLTKIIKRPDDQTTDAVQSQKIGEGQAVTTPQFQRVYEASLSSYGNDHMPQDPYPTLETRNPNLGSYTSPFISSTEFEGDPAFHRYAHTGERNHGGSFIPYIDSGQRHGGDFMAPSDVDKPIPSWIPILSDSAWGNDFDTRARQNADFLVGPPSQRPYNAAGGLIAEVIFGRSSAYTSFANEGQRALRSTLLDGYQERVAVKGFPIGIINELSLSAINGSVPKDALVMGGFDPWYDAGAPLPAIPDRLWRTLVADRDKSGHKPPYWYYLAAVYCLSAVVKTNAPYFDTTILPSDSRSDSVLHFLERVQSVVWGRRFFKSAYNNLFGLVPGAARTGDLVCILYGCSVPVVLRRNQNISTFTFVGEAYVDGMMDGEALQGNKREDTEAISNWFVLW